MAFEQQLHSRIGRREFSTFLNFSGNTVLLKVNAGDNTAEATWTIGLAPKSLKFDVTAHMGAHAACIITCLGIGVGKALLECLLSSTTIQEIEECLKKKGNWGPC